MLLDDAVGDANSRPLLSVADRCFQLLNSLGHPGLHHHDVIRGATAIKIHFETTPRLVGGLKKLLALTLPIAITLLSGYPSSSRRRSIPGANHAASQPDVVIKLTFFRNLIRRQHGHSHRRFLTISAAERLACYRLQESSSPKQQRWGDAHSRCILKSRRHA